ncbi:hypothetical protein D3C71_1709260 [compost metagenome]
MPPQHRQKAAVNAQRERQTVLPGDEGQGGQCQRQPQPDRSVRRTPLQPEQNNRQCNQGGKQSKREAGVKRREIKFTVLRQQEQRSGTQQPAEWQQPAKRHSRDGRTGVVAVTGRGGQRASPGFPERRPHRGKQRQQEQ